MNGSSPLVKKLVYMAIVILSLALLSLMATLPALSLSANPVYMKF